MVGQSVYLFKNEIIKDSNELVDSELIDYLLYDETYGKVGKIEEVNDYAGNVVFTVDFNGKELLVPYNEDFFISIDKNKKDIILKIPEGLLET
jgi:16S rRNA processing protein RimM